MILKELLVEHEKILWQFLLLPLWLAAGEDWKQGRFLPFSPSFAYCEFVVSLLVMIAATYLFHCCLASFSRWNMFIKFDKFLQHYYKT